MKITSIEPIAGVRVETDEEEYSVYTRWGPRSWTVEMGMSDESVSFPEEIEELYQEFLKLED